MSAELRAGQTFGGYHIVELVGSGGMGLVYRAEQRILGRTVALKVIRPEIAESGDYRARFLREARLPLPLTIRTWSRYLMPASRRGRLYLAMQWVDGLDLGTLLDREQRLAPERAVLIGVQLAQALQAVHDAGLVHRDVKPSNVLVRAIGGHDYAYLTDFGIAKAPAAQDSLTRTGWVIGTPGYLHQNRYGASSPARAAISTRWAAPFSRLSPASARSVAMTIWRRAGPRRPAHHRRRQPYIQLWGLATTRSLRKRSRRIPRIGFRPARHSRKPSKPPTLGGRRPEQTPATRGALRGGRSAPPPSRQPSPGPGRQPLRPHPARAIRRCCRQRGHGRPGRRRQSLTSPRQRRHRRPGPAAAPARPGPVPARAHPGFSCRSADRAGWRPGVHRISDAADSLRQQRQRLEKPVAGDPR